MKRNLLWKTTLKKYNQAHPKKLSNLPVNGNVQQPKKFCFIIICECTNAKSGYCSIMCECAFTKNCNISIMWECTTSQSGYFHIMWTCTLSQSCYYLCMVIRTSAKSGKYVSIRESALLKNSHIGWCGVSLYAKSSQIDILWEST